MAIATIQICFYISLILGFTIGSAIMYWRARGLYRQYIAPPKSSEAGAGKSNGKSTAKNADHSLSTDSIFLLMIPAVIAFFVFCAPAIYFNYLIKQHSYCVNLVKINKIQSPNDKFLQERCAKFDADELISVGRN